MDQEQARFIAQSIFSYYDKDKSGQLNDQELIQMMMNNYQYMGQRFSPSKQDIDQYADVLDATKNRQITLADFESLCIKYFTQNQINIVFQRQIKKKQYTQYAQDRLDKAKQLFKRFDNDGSGEIDENEAHKLLEETFKQCGMQKTPTKDDLIQWMALTDTNGDGNISLEEFQDLVIKNYQYFSIQNSVYVSSQKQTFFINVEKTIQQKQKFNMKYILLTTLLILSFAKLDYSSRRSISTVMATIESKLASKSPLDAIIRVLNEFRDAINLEQISHDEIYDVQQKECSSEHEFRQKEITQNSNVLRDSSAQLKACTTQKVRASSSFEVNERQSFTNNQQMELIVLARDQEEAYYKKRSQDYQDSLYAIEEAQDIITSLYSGAGSLIEVSKISRKLLQNALNIKLFNGYAQVLAQLARIGKSFESNFDETSLERASQLLDTLRKQVKDAFDDYAEGNAVAVQLFNDQKERLRTTSARIVKQHDRLEKVLNGLSQCIGSQSAIAQQSSNKLQRATQLYDQAVVLCATFQNEYNYATQGRRSEQILVTQLEEMVERRFGQVQDEQHERKQRLQ
ncbi:hypothetical protein pb186bvf_017250 [Paramecium bursaria]